MLKIRLTRTGKKNDPRFRIVVAEHTKPIKGKFVQIVGHYDPIHKDLVIKKEEIISWLDKGAKPTNRVSILLTKEGVKHNLIKIQKFNKKPKAKKGAKAEEAQAPTAAPEEKKAPETAEAKASETPDKEAAEAKKEGTTEEKK